MMRQFCNLKLIAPLCLLALVAICFMPTRVRAGSLSIEPLRQELILQPGQSITGHLFVRNSGKSQITVSLHAEDFGIVNEQYDYSFSASESLGKWVNLGQNGSSLDPGQVKNFTYTVGAPNNTEPGAKYIAIFAQVKNTPRDGSIATIEKAGSLLYITVPGATVKQGTVTDFNLPHLSFSRDVDWNLRIRAQGNVHFHSLESVSSALTPGKYGTEQQDDHLILPNTVRLISGTAVLGRWPGIYRVKFLVGLGDSPAFKKTAWVIYAPIMPTIFIIAASGLLIRKLFKRIKARS